MSLKRWPVIIRFYMVKFISYFTLCTIFISLHLLPFHVFSFLYFIPLFSFYIEYSHSLSWLFTSLSSLQSAFLSNDSSHYLFIYFSCLFLIHPCYHSYLSFSLSFSLSLSLSLSPSLKNSFLGTCKVISLSNGIVPEDSSFNYDLKKLRTVSCKAQNIF